MAPLIGGVKLGTSAGRGPLAKLARWAIGIRATGLHDAQPKLAPHGSSDFAIVPRYPGAMARLGRIDVDGIAAELNVRPGKTRTGPPRLMNVGAVALTA